MKRIYWILVFLVTVHQNYSQGIAGPDKAICLGSSITIGSMTEDPRFCYSWKASPADPSLINVKTSKITVSPTQNTIYALTIIGQDFSTKSTDEVVVTVINNSNISITWDVFDYTLSNANAVSTTVPKPFVVEYTACPDVGNNVWRLIVKKVTGDVNIKVNTGGSRDPFNSPPTTEVEAIDAINTMKDYYARGTRGSWHTESASKSHEEYHYTEWRCASEHFWSITEACLERFTVPYNLYPDEPSAIAALKVLGVDAKISEFKDAAENYWSTLGDGAGDRPYAAGQLTLNLAIIFVQTLASNNGWNVPQGTSSPSTLNPCYQPFNALILTSCP